MSRALLIWMGCAALLAASRPDVGQAASSIGFDFVDGTDGARQPEAVGINWWGFSVSAISTSATAPVTFRVQFSGTPSAVSIDLAATGTVSLANSAGIWSGSVTAAQALYGYTAEDANHNFVGYLRVYEGGVLTSTYNLFIDVVDGNVAPVTPVVVSSTFQYSCHVANLLRSDLTLPPSSAFHQSAVAQALSLLGDEFDFVNLVYTQPGYQANRGYYLVKNTVSGIGLAMRDQTAAWGSSGRLLGVTQYPIEGFFDLAETASIHEMGHQWINFSTMPLLVPGIPHWRPGTNARGIMGFSMPNGVGGTFPFDLVPIGGGIYQMVASSQLRLFTDLDLYYMGFLPPDSVGTNLVFDDPNIPVQNGSTGTVTSFGVADVIAAQGPRVPGVAGSPHRFRVGTVVVTRDRLLSAEELAFFDHMAARGQSTVPLPFSAGFDRGTTNPFRVATRGLGTLYTSILSGCDPAAVDPPPTRADVEFRVTSANPCAGEVGLEWTQPARGNVRIAALSVSGARVACPADGTFEPGTHLVSWATGRLAPGVYFVSLEVGGRRVAQCRLVLLH